MGFTRILIANRGEIACRILRTARAMGYRTVAVYSDADAEALHVRMADQAVRIGPPPPKDSYLHEQALLHAARLTGADAVHPGYGFLSENAEFARACEEAGLVFIGPAPSAIAAMGNKAAAKRLMKAAQVPCVPGYDGEEQSDSRLAQEANQIGFPVMVKAAAGGGGRGMRRVERPEDLLPALSGARSEALNAFGSGDLILEKAIQNARHVEIQVFADAYGDTIHLGERDCSVQRRHQKVIEEAPSPAVSAELRTRMGEAAVSAARAIGYRGAGTVEFLLDASGAFYFLEMNTRLQVEHPVTEAITGLDLVEWQLRVAAGERLPLSQHEIAFKGHAIEARLYAEDPAQGFAPRTGTVCAWEPASNPGIRTDHGLRVGHAVEPDYDAMLAKVIAHGATRGEARRKLIAALEDTCVLGVTTNRAFLCRVLRDATFASGKATTEFLERRFSGGEGAESPHVAADLRSALGAVVWFENSAAPASGGAAARPWSSSGTSSWHLRLIVEEDDYAITLILEAGGGYQVEMGGKSLDLRIIEREEGKVRFLSGGIQRTARYAFTDRNDPHAMTLYVDCEGGAATIRESRFAQGKRDQTTSNLQLIAPMNGRIVAVLASAGESVSKGQRIVVLEAMKMQHEILSPQDGILGQVSVKPGEQVATRQVLAVLTPPVQKASD